MTWYNWIYHFSSKAEKTANAKTLRENKLAIFEGNKQGHHGWRVMGYHEVREVAGDPIIFESVSILSYPSLILGTSASLLLISSCSESPIISVY